MNESDKEFVEADYEYRKVKVVNGGVEIVSVKSLVGYCHFFIHTGFITKNVLKTKDCDVKNCRFFEKLEENPYWKNREEQLKGEEEKKIRIKELKEAKKGKEALIEEIKTEACRLVEQLNYPIVICNVREKKKKFYLVTFVSENPFDDAPLYGVLARNLRNKFDCDFLMQRIRKSDGGYARPSDIRK